MTENKDDVVERLASRIDELTKRVDDLEDRIDESSESGSQSDLLDRYDQYVVENSEDVESAHPLELKRLYEEAGVRDKKKQKRRAKRLKRVVGDA